MSDVVCAGITLHRRIRVQVSPAAVGHRTILHRSNQVQDYAPVALVARIRGFGVSMHTKTTPLSPSLHASVVLGLGAHRDGAPVALAASVRGLGLQCTQGDDAPVALAASVRGFGPQCTQITKRIPSNSGTDAANPKASQT